MSAMKQISIDELKPGMFITDIDVPWYRTPFLFHKRLIPDTATIQLMKQSGVKMVTIDTSKGRDVADQSNPPEHVPVSLTEGADVSAPTPLKTERVGSDHTGRPMPSPSAVIYAEVQEALERIFADLERGVPPTPAETKAVTSRVLSQVLEERDALITQSVYRKMKDFDRSLAAHSLDTCILSLVVAIESESDSALFDHVGGGALLHDVGYIRLPRNLIRKRYTCTESERQLLQQHPQLGAALLREQGEFPEEVLRIVLEHHEHDDGSGFPNGTTGEAVSPLSQLVGIVNFYDGLVSRRGGRPAMTPHDAIRQLFLAGERKHYPKPLVEAVIRSIGVYPIGSLVRLNTGEQAVVVGTNPTQRLKPQIKIIGGPDGESYATPEQIDLSMPNQHGIARTILRVLDPLQERVDISAYLGDPASQASS